MPPAFYIITKLQILEITNNFEFVISVGSYVFYLHSPAIIITITTD